MIVTVKAAVSSCISYHFSTKFEKKNTRSLLNSSKSLDIEIVVPVNFLLVEIKKKIFHQCKYKKMFFQHAATYFSNLYSKTKIQISSSKFLNIIPI